MKDLADLLRFEVQQVHNIVRHVDSHLRRFQIASKYNPKKVRKIVAPRQPLYNVQRYFLQSVLMPHFKPSPFNHGGVPGRNILSNANAHAGSHFVYKTDITDFFPSISYQRVQAWFEANGCSRAVAGACTRLCTADGRLEQGLITSPFLADQLMAPVDLQLNRMCQKLHLTYTRYVDDIAISGHFDMEHTKIPPLVRRILRINGFHAKIKKEEFGAIEDGIDITKVSFRSGHPDVQREYIAALEQLLRDHIDLSNGVRVECSIHSQAQLWGKAEFVGWINPRRRSHLRGLLSKIDWLKLFEYAVEFDLIGNLVQPVK